MMGRLSKSGLIFSATRLSRMGALNRTKGTALLREDKSSTIVFVVTALVDCSSGTSEAAVITREPFGA